MKFWLDLLKDWGIAFAVVVGVWAIATTFLGGGGPSLGPAPDFHAPELGAGQFTLSELKADTVVLNFWFTSCPPCRAEIPELSAYAEADPPAPIYGVAAEATAPSKLMVLAGKLGVRYPVLHDQAGTVSRAFGVSVYPTTLILHHGEIVDSHVGVLTAARLRAMVEAAKAAHGH